MHTIIIIYIKEGKVVKILISRETISLETDLLHFVVTVSQILFNRRSKITTNQFTSTRYRIYSNSNRTNKTK